MHRTLTFAQISHKHFAKSTDVSVIWHIGTEWLNGNNQTTNNSINNQTRFERSKRDRESESRVRVRVRTGGGGGEGQTDRESVREVRIRFYDGIRFDSCPKILHQLYRGKIIIILIKPLYNNI